MTDKNDFLYPHCSYRGNGTPENVVFHDNLQEFSHKVGYIVALESGAKLDPSKAYYEIKQLWKHLKKSRKNLGIGSKTFGNEGSESINE